jgi:hypothetical protein
LGDAHQLRAEAGEVGSQARLGLADQDVLRGDR